MADRHRKLVPDGDRCGLCGEKVYSSDLFEYSKTKRGQLIFVHRSCWDSLKEGVK